jgi:Putative zinc-finger
MTCQDARDLFSARADDALSRAEQAQLQAHLATCAECEREWMRLERTVALVQAIEPAHAPAGFVDRVLAAQTRPWYARLVHGLFVPWPVKLPLEAAAIVLVAGLAIMIVQRSPELQQASRLPEPPRPESAPMRMRESPAIATPPPAKTGKMQTGGAAAPPAAAPPDTSSSRIDSPPLGLFPPEQRPAPATAPSPREQARDAVESAQEERRGAMDTPREPARVAAEPPRAPAPIAGAESRAKSDEERNALLRKEADPSDARLSARKAPAVASPPAVATAPAPSAVPEERSVTRQNLAQDYAQTSSDLRARLAVGERAGAESTVRDLVARAGGQVLSQVKDGHAAVLRLIIPDDRWDELRRGLETLGTLRVEGQKAEGAGQLLITLRLER